MMVRDQRWSRATEPKKKAVKNSTSKIIIKRLRRQLVFLFMIHSSSAFVLGQVGATTACLGVYSCDFDHPVKGLSPEKTSEPFQKARQNVQQRTSGLAIFNYAAIIRTASSTLYPGNALYSPGYRLTKTDIESQGSQKASINKRTAETSLHGGKSAFLGSLSVDR